MSQRPGNKIVYSEAYKMLLRGLLFTAPQTLREKYEDTLKPIILNGVVTGEHVIGTELSEEEVALVDQFVKEMKSIPVPDKEEAAANNLDIAKRYVAQITAISYTYIPQLDFFRENLQTITGNIAAREVIINTVENEPLEAAPEEAQITEGYKSAVHVLKDEDLKKYAEDEERKLNEFYGDEDNESP